MLLLASLYIIAELSTNITDLALSRLNSRKAVRGLQDSNTDSLENSFAKGSGDCAPDKPREDYYDVGSGNFYNAYYCATYSDNKNPYSFVEESDDVKGPPGCEPDAPRDAGCQKIR